MLYDGSTGRSTFSYSAAEASLAVDPDNSNVGFIVWDVPLADGGPGGIALIDGCNNVVHFMSYEGSFMATEGLAENLVSSDIRYSESGRRTDEFSLQRIGVGFDNARVNNEWIVSKRTRGASNALQVLGECSPVGFDFVSYTFSHLPNTDFLHWSGAIERDTLRRLF